MKEVSSVKDSVASRLHAKGSMVEANGCGERPIMCNVKQTEVFMVEKDTEEEKMIFTTCKTKKKGSWGWLLSLRHCGDPRSVRSLWKTLYRWWVNLRKGRGPPRWVSHCDVS